MASYWVSMLIVRRTVIAAHISAFHSIDAFMYASVP